MKTLSFNSLKPLAFTALFVVFAASFNTAEAESYGCPDNDKPCKDLGNRCESDPDCHSGCCDRIFPAPFICMLKFNC